MSTIDILGDADGDVDWMSTGCRTCRSCPVDISKSCRSCHAFLPSFPEAGTQDARGLGLVVKPATIYTTQHYLFRSQTIDFVTLTSRLSVSCIYVFIAESFVLNGFMAFHWASVKCEDGEDAGRRGAKIAMNGVKLNKGKDGKNKDTRNARNARRPVTAGDSQLESLAKAFNL